MRDVEFGTMLIGERKPLESRTMAGMSLQPEPLLPLWLTEAEAAAILTLCASAPEDAGEEIEASLFGKLGQLLRAFQN